jgi:type IV fimbrial biogenesis protein FimT
MTNSWRVLGFSLIETLFVLLVLAILCGTAVSSFQSLQVRAQVQAASQALLSDVLSARTEALRREKRVTLCAAAATSDACELCKMSAYYTPDDVTITPDMELPV